MLDNFSSKLPNLPTSIFSVMNQVAMQHEAINLAQGFPDFDTDPKLIAYVDEAMKQGYNQYAPMAGIYSLRKAISDKIASMYNATYDPDNGITITVGATQALYTAITAFVHPGDEVIIFKPAYDCYEPAIRVNGGIPVVVQMKGRGYDIDWAEFKSALSPKTRMVVINSPHNPSGRVLANSDMQQLQYHLEGTSVLVLSDEAYEHLVYDNMPNESVAKYPGLAARSLICASFGKTFHTTGWKMGYCAAPRELMAEFRKIHEFNVFAVSHPVQRALAKYLNEPEHYLQLPQFFQAKRDFFLDGLSGSRFRFQPCEGTYFQLLDYSEITDERDVDFSRRLAAEYGVAAIPISVFNQDNEDHKQLRFCFAKKRETLERATRILRKV